MGPVGSVIIAVCFGGVDEELLEAPKPVSARKRTMPRKKVDSIVFYPFVVGLKKCFG
jgi:hypothetical protein